VDSRRSGTDLSVASLIVWVAAWIVFPAAGYGSLFVVLAASAVLAVAGLVQSVRPRHNKLGIGISLGVLVLSTLTALSVFSLLSVIDN
jgi:hypothetical protein